MPSGTNRPRALSPTEGELESPFLNEELFVQGAETAWQPRLTGPRSESPFQRLSFEEAFSAAVESEVYDDELSETEDESEDEAPNGEIAGLEPEAAAEHGAEEEGLFELFAPEVSQADLRKRIDEYFDLANAEYTLPDGSKVKARPQFQYAKAGNPEKDTQTVEKILKAKFGEKFSKPLHDVIRCAAYGRARPDDIRVITQALIDAGQLDLDAARGANPGLSDNQHIRALQFKLNIGIDCAGYVQLAFIYAFTEKHDAAKCTLSDSKLREGLGLTARRGSEKLADLPSTHFRKVDIVDAQTGDLFVMFPRVPKDGPGCAAAIKKLRRGDYSDFLDRDWHTVIVVEHTSAGSEHTFVVDASWGTDLYTEIYGGVARRKLVHDTSTGVWWDIHPKDGTKANENPIGPYAGHCLKGMYRAKQKGGGTSGEIDEERQIEGFAGDSEDLVGEEAEEELGEYQLEEEWEVEWEPEGEVYDDMEARELDPVLLDIAERTIARETPIEEYERSRRWTGCFSAADVAKVQRVYEENAAAAAVNSGDRCSCIVMLNVALGQLLSLPLKENRARSTSDRRVQMADLTTETIEKAMRQLRRKGFALAPLVMEFLDRRGRRAGTLKPERLKASVRDKVLAESKVEECWFAFGMSIMDGYHSVLLLVDHTAPTAKTYWLDQFSTGLDDDVTDSLDQRITDKTQTWWQAVMDSKHKGYDTTIRLWPLRKRKTTS